MVIDKEMKEYCIPAGERIERGEGGRVINVCVCAWRKAREKSALFKGQFHKILKYFFIVNLVSEYCKLISHFMLSMHDFCDYISTVSLSQVKVIINGTQT